jgi:hypothetical protein
MKKIPSVKKIIKKNPKVDAKQLAEGMKLFEELRKAGLQRRRYSLVPPFTGKRVQIVDASVDEAHTIHLPRER